MIFTLYINISIFKMKLHKYMCESYQGWIRSFIYICTFVILFKKYYLEYNFFFFLNVTHKGRKYLTITEHVFHCSTHFSCQILSFIHAFVLHTNVLKVDADYIPEPGFFSWDFGSKYHNLYIMTPCLMRPFQEFPSL
jgi:hypothetical protein